MFLNECVFTVLQQWRDQAYPLWHFFLSLFTNWLVQFTALISSTHSNCTQTPLWHRGTNRVSHIYAHVWWVVWQTIDLHFAISEVDQQAILPFNVYISLGYLTTKVRLPLVRSLCPWWPFHLAWPFREAVREVLKHISTWAKKIELIYFFDCQHNGCVKFTHKVVQEKETKSKIDIL